MKRMHSLALLPAFVIGFAAAHAAPMSAMDFVSKAGAGDLYEQKSSELVLGSTKNPKVRSFAQMMVKDHAKTAADVKAAAMQAGLKPKPPEMDAAKATMVSDLAAAKGRARDQLYLQQQKAAHQEALTLHRNYSSTGDKPQLKAVAAKAVGVVEHHIDMLRSM